MWAISLLYKGQVLVILIMSVKTMLLKLEAIVLIWLSWSAVLYLYNSFYLKIVDIDNGMLGGICGLLIVPSIACNQSVMHIAYFFD